MRHPSKEGAKTFSRWRVCQSSSLGALFQHAIPAAFRLHQGVRSHKHGMLSRNTPALRRQSDLARWNEPYQEARDRKSTRLNSSHMSISYAVFCLKKKKSVY